MSNPDSQFTRRFSIIISLLVVITIALVFLSRGIMDITPTADEPAARAPVAVAAATASAAPASPAGTGTQAASAGADGQTVYQQVCALCHAMGIAGAPKVGDTVAWGPRIAKGKTTLYDHALHGFASKTGMMPPKAGHMELSDASVQAAGDYMVAKSGG